MQRVILVLGATGATGKLVVEQLLDLNCKVKALVRTPSRVPEHYRAHPNLEIIQGTLLDLQESRVFELLSDCTNIVSCLGHNMTWKGIYGKPRWLVRDSLIRSIQCARPGTHIVLMNTVGYRNPAIDPQVSLMQRIAILCTRVLIPPHADNEEAAEFLRNKKYKDPSMKWVVVRPDSLIDEPNVTAYDLHKSPIRTLFKPGKTSRINVANFMARLCTNEYVWEEWEGCMPVIYNTESEL